MRIALIPAAACVGAALMLGSIAGCQTATPGVTNVAGAYRSTIDGRPDRVTNAARKALNEMKLLEVMGNGTTVDGRVTARTADNTEITIDIQQAGEKMSTVSIRVGAMGDEAMSRQILDKIKDNMRWF